MIENIVKLSNGVEMPHIGLGTYPMMGQQLTDALLAAYNVGYRLVDTADNYYNEKDLGESLKELYNRSNAKREDMFLVSKVSDELYHPHSVGGGQNKGMYFWKTSPEMQKPYAVYEIVNRKIDNTLSFLKTDYLDLYLMHWPYPDYFQEIWYEMEQVYKSGKIRAIGVCNCRPRHFERLLKSCEICPMVNQFETSPINTKSSIVEFCNNHNIKVMVYSPLMSLRIKEKRDYQAYLSELAAKYECTPAQINLRFDIQRGLIPIPKSSNPARLKSNFSVFDFNITSEEMDVLMSFNEDYQTLPESKSCPGL